MVYIGIKLVDAVAMDSTEAVLKGYRVNISESNSPVEGYEVMYDDGYKSWCPKMVFDKHNYPIKNLDLAKTCSLMMSSDYKDRFKAEYLQLKNRYEGLKAMCTKWDNNELDFKPTCSRRTYELQMQAMKDYLDVLTQRAKEENIDVQ